MVNPMNEQPNKISEQFGPGDMLTKMEVCQLFCERLRISKSTYYKKIYPFLKFQPLEKPLTSSWNIQKGTERMPYTIAIGILNKVTGFDQKTDPPQYELNNYLK